MSGKKKNRRGYWSVACERHFPVRLEPWSWFQHYLTSETRKFFCFHGQGVSTGRKFALRASKEDGSEVREGRRRVSEPEYCVWPEKPGVPLAGA